MPIKYSFELLTSFCDKNSVKLSHDYSEEKLFHIFNQKKYTL